MCIASMIERCCRSSLFTPHHLLHPPITRLTRGGASVSISSCLTPPPVCFALPPTKSDGGSWKIPYSMQKSPSILLPMDHSISGSNSQQKHCRFPLEEQSLSQESCNHANQYPVANNGKNGESSVGSHAPQPIQTEPIIPAVQDEAVPLSGSPYFTCIVSKSQTQSPFQLAIPRRFCSLLPSESVSVFLSCGRRTWEMRYCGDSSLKRFDRGWKNFALDNNLKVGDGCVFELIDHKSMKFQVRILRGEIPSPVVDRAGGQSYDSPIMID